MKKKSEFVPPKTLLIREKNKLMEGIEVAGKICPRSIRLFIVELIRWGDDEGHHYITGVYSTYKAALKNADLNMELRGGKYSAKIYETLVDDIAYVKLYRVIDWGDEL